MDNNFNNLSLVQLVLKWKWHIIIITVVAALCGAIFSSSLFITPLYKSVAVAYPANISPYSDESETEQMLEIINSRSIMDSVIEKYEEHLHPGDDLGEIVRQISSSERDIFPVVDEAGKLLAVLVLDRVRHVMFRTELYHRLHVRDLMSQCAARLTTNDAMDVVVAAFDRTKAWTLPVVDATGTFVGFIRRSHVFAMYRQMMADLSDE